MNENRMMNQISAVFGVFMTVFYIGVGLYIALSGTFTNYDKALTYIVGFTFALYGIYRGYRSYVKFREAFFSKSDDSE